MKGKVKKNKFKNLKMFAYICLGVIVLKIIYMTTFKYQHYTELAEFKTFKKLTIQAPRGEIRDKYGRLIAGNKTQFAVQVSGDSLNKKGKKDPDEANRIALKLINLLEANKEKYIDEFPIYVENGKYFYTFDRNINQFRKENAIPEDITAKQAFYLIIDRAIQEGTISPDIKKLEPAEQQARLNRSGIYPPISVKEWKYAEQKAKEDWLERYGIDKPVNAREAFTKIRNTKYMSIKKSVSDEDARKIMLVKDMIRSKGYTQFTPVTVAKNIGDRTIAQIEENSINLRGVSVAVEQIRYYPDGKLASHILGHVGKIPATLEKDYLEKGYSKDDMIGLQGLEKSYEDKLRGKPGYREVKVDALGRISQELKSVNPVSGDTLYLTIDSELQKVAEKSLKGSIDSANGKGAFESKYGPISFGESAAKAKSGAVIAVDVKNGKVLASASYPDFDPNVFAKGITSDEYKELQPTNMNDLLAANPLLNLVTQGVFQPGSTFKMVTGMAALENGLNPNYTIQDPGFVKLGSRIFADYVWHHGGHNHGAVNLYKAIQESCNIYFYTVGSGKNFMNNTDLKINMGPSKILEYAKKFGLDSPSGLNREIEERYGRVPNEKTKLENTQELLKEVLTKKMSNDFTDITQKKDPDEYKKRIDEIVSWAAEEKTPGRVETMKRLEKMKVKEDKIEEITDLAVFTYFNFAKWSTADTFNLAIGQGENAYNPAQIVRYVAAIANGGNLVDLSLVDKSISSDYKSVTINKNTSGKIDFKDDRHLKDLTTGMKRVSSEGTSKSIFGKFPVEVASKTGTAEKSGKIPTENEYEYLKSHIGYYGVNLDDAIELSKKLIKEKEAEKTAKKIEEVKKEIASPETSKEDREKLEKELKEGIKVELDKTDKIKAFYLRKAIKELNPKITDDRIDTFKPDYGSFAWAVAFAPADNPEIAVACVIPQGETSNYALLAPREIIGEYFKVPGIQEQKEKEEQERKEQMEKEKLEKDKKSKNSSENSNRTQDGFQKQNPDNIGNVNRQNNYNGNYGTNSGYRKNRKVNGQGVR